MLIAVALVVATIDQVSKNWVVANLPPGEPIPVVGEALQWLFVRNPGAAFSMASGATWVFTILAAVVAGVIVWQIRRLRSVPWALFLGLLLGGVLGNLTDRLTRAPGFPEGHVIDFIYTPWMMPAIYNVADVAIVSAMCIFVLVTLLGLPITGGPRERTRKELETVEADQVNDATEPAADAQPTAPGEENEVRNGTA
nr:MULTISPECIES: signal peptidase II [unclassified Leucobacter]